MSHTAAPQPINAVLHLSHKNSGPCLPKLSIVKCHCISGNLARDQKIMVLPQQFNISSSPHCSFSLNFIQPTTHESSFFVVNVISQILSHFIISSLPCIHLGTQAPLRHAVAIFHGLPSTNKQTNDAQLIIVALALRYKDFSTNDGHS